MLMEKRPWTQLRLKKANRERELQNTYLVQELDKLKDRKQLIESFIWSPKKSYEMQIIWQMLK